MLVSPLLSNENTLPWWVCPPDRELSLRSKIRTGYSTIASRANMNKYHPIIGVKVRGLSVDELMTIEEVIKKASAVEEMNDMRISSLLAEHEDLKEKCQGDGEYTCILCGYDFAQPNAEKSTLCYICAKMICRECRYDDVMSKGHVYLCPVCFSHKELWCKTGAWMINSLPKQIQNKEKITEWMSKTSEFKRHKSSLDMSIDLGGAVRQDTSQNLLENVPSDTELFNENRLSSYNVQFKDNSSDGYRPLSQTLSPNWSTLEDLKEEEKVGCDDLLLAQQLRAESPHLRLESEHRRASADVGVTPSPPPSPQRSSAMCKAQRVSLGNVRRNVLSRTPSPQGYGTNDTSSPPMRRRAGSKENDSPLTRRRGSSKDSGQLLVKGELKIPANSFDSDSSVEVNRELLRVHQMGSTTDEEMPLIMISSDIEAQLYYGDEQNDERRFSSPKLKRKNASRRRRGSAKAKVEVEQDEEVETKGETNLYNQDGESDLSFQPLESDLNFQPMQTDLNFDSKLSSTKPVHSDTTEHVRDEKETPLIDTAPVKPPDSKEEPEEETVPVQPQEEQTNINGINEERTSETPAQEEEEEKEEEGSTGLLNEDLSDLSFSFRKSDDEDEPKQEKLKKPAPAAGADKVSKPVTPLPPQPMSPSTHSDSPSVSPSIPSVSPLVSSPPPTATSSPPHSATPPPQSGLQSPKTPPPHSAVKPTQSAPVNNPPTQSAPVSNPPTQSAPVNDLPTQSAPVSDPPTQSVTAPPTQPPKTESPKPAPRRRTLIVKSSPSNSEIKTPPPSSSPQEPAVAAAPPSPVQSKGVKDDGETGGKQFEEKSGFSLRRKNATRSGGSKSPRHNSKEVSPLTTSQETEGMNTLERKRAKAKEAARRLRESGQASQYRSEKQETSVSSVESEGMSTLERKRAKAREAARRLKQGGESSQSRIERDAQGEIIQEKRLYGVEYRPESPASLI